MRSSWPLFGLLLAVCIIPAGCLDGDYAANDASVPQDMALNFTFDLSNYDLYGLTNCVDLNKCEHDCKTNACVYMCRNQATPTAVAKDTALQSCLTQYCPTGAGGVCAPDMTGTMTMACMACLQNAQKSPSESCSPTQLPSECGMCYSQSQACLTDQ